MIAIWKPSAYTKFVSISGKGKKGKLILKLHILSTLVNEQIIMSIKGKLSLGPLSIYDHELSKTSFREGVFVCIPDPDR